MSDLVNQIRERFNYDPESGLLTWKVNRRGSAKTGSEGSVAGWRGNRKYLRVQIDGKKHLAHRVAWMHFHGEVLRSDQHIDHINGDKSDNRIENLRVVTFQENMQNIRSARSHGKSGLLGVGWHNLEAELAALLKAIHELQLLIELEYPNQSL